VKQSDITSLKAGLVSGESDMNFQTLKRRWERKLFKETCLIGKFLKRIIE